MLVREIIHTELQPSLAQFKSHVRITSNDLDAELSLKLKAAIRAAEHEIGMIIAKSRFTYTGKFSQSIRIESYPLIRVDSVRVDNRDLQATDYAVNEGVLSFAEGITGTDVELVYTAGMEQVEYDITAAILLHAAKLFNNPVDSVETLPTQSANLLRPYRRWGLRYGK